jgi:hypothetical protein
MVIMAKKLFTVGLCRRIISSQNFFFNNTIAKDIQITPGHHHSEHGQGLGLKTYSFEAQGVPGPSITPGELNKSRSSPLCTVVKFHT